MNASRPIASILLSFALLCMTGCFSPPPKQQALSARFERERGTYETLRKMVQEDGLADILDYGDEFKKPGEMNFRGAHEIGLSEIRADAYRQLMDEVDVQRILTSEDGEVRLALASWGMASRGWRVLVTWREAPPSPLLASLDDFQRAPNRNDWRTAYAPAGGNWYFEIIW